MSSESAAAAIDAGQLAEPGDVAPRPGVEPWAWPVAVFAGVLVWALAGASGEATVHAALLVVLVAAASVDLRHRVLPNRLIVPAIPILLAGHAINDLGSFTEHVVAMVATGLVFYLLAVVSRGGMGMGDVKAAALMGAGLGSLVLSALFVGTLVSGLLGIALLIRNGTEARKTAIPLGPFLAFGTFAVLVIHGLS